MRNEIFIPEHKTNILPLRWLVNGIFHRISMLFFRIGLRAAERMEHDGKNTRTNAYLEYIGWTLYSLFDKPYSKWGTVYEFVGNLDNLGGPGWDDYDEKGIPYWDYWWHEDPETGDAWRIVNRDFKYEDVRDGSIIPEIQKDM